MNAIISISNRSSRVNVSEDPYYYHISYRSTILSEVKYVCYLRFYDVFIVLRENCLASALPSLSCILSYIAQPVPYISSLTFLSRAYRFLFPHSNHLRTLGAYFWLAVRSGVRFAMAHPFRRLWSRAIDVKLIPYGHKGGLSSAISRTRWWSEDQILGPI